VAIVLSDLLRILTSPLVSLNTIAKRKVEDTRGEVRSVNQQRTDRTIVKRKV
jgi:hypothetical protein